GSDDRGPEAAWNADNIHYVKLTVRAALPASATHHGTHVTPQRRSRSNVSEPEGARRLASASSGRHPQDTDFRIPPITELSILPFKRAPDTVYLRVTSPGLEARDLDCDPLPWRRCRKGLTHGRRHHNRSRCRRHGGDPQTRAEAEQAAAGQMAVHTGRALQGAVLSHRPSAHPATPPGSVPRQRAQPPRGAQ